MRLVTVFFLFVILSGCSLFKTNRNQSTTLKQRYNETEGSINIESNKALVEVECKILPPIVPKSDPAKTVFDLTPEGQKSYIKTIGELAKGDMTKFNNEMNQKFLEDKDNILYTDISKRNIRIVFSINQKDLYKNLLKSTSLGDRIENIKLNLQLDSNSIFKFTNWSLFNSKYAQVDISSNTFTYNKAISVNPTIPLTSGALSIGSLNTTKGVSVTDSSKKTIVLATGILQDDHLLIEQTGSSEINLNGNSTIDFTMDLKDNNKFKDVINYYTFDNLKSKNEFSDPKKVQINENVFYYPQMLSNDSATLTCSYVVRHIIQGDNTIIEDDDDIIFNEGEINPQKICLINKSEIIKPQWGIKTANKEYIQIHDTISKTYNTLSFNSDQEALDFLTWLRYTVSKLKNTDPKKTIKIIIDRFELLTKNINDEVKYIDNKIDLDKTEIVIIKQTN